MTMPNSYVAVIIGALSFLNILLISRLLLSKFQSSSIKARRKLTLVSNFSRPDLVASRAKSSFLTLDKRIERIGNQVVSNDYRRRLNELALQSGQEEASILNLVVKQKIYFAALGLFLTFTFLLRSNWTLVVISIVLTLLGYVLPNSLGLTRSLLRSKYSKQLSTMARLGSKRWQDQESLLTIKLLTSLLGFITSYLYALVQLDSNSIVLWTLSGLLVGFFVPDIILYNNVTKRREKFAQSLPDAIDLLSMCVSAGLAFPAALAKVSEIQKGPVPEEFMRVRVEVQLGKDRNDALREMTERIRLPSLERFVNAVAQVDRFGIPISNVLMEQARELRSDRRARAREKAQKVPIKILGPVMLCFLPCVLLVVLGPAVIGILRAF